MKNNITDMSALPLKDTSKLRDDILLKNSIKIAEYINHRDNNEETDAELILEIYNKIRKFIRNQ